MAATEPASTTASVPGSAAGRRRVSARAIVVLACVAVVVYGVDQLTKFLVSTHLVEGTEVNVIGNLLVFHFVKNPGAAFSLASGTTWIFSIAASAVAIFIIIFARRIRSTAWAVLFGMLLGGTTGNLTDRLFREPGFGVGHVVDFIQVYGFPAIFNIADSFICASMGLFIVLTLRGTRLDGTRSTKKPQAPNTPADSPASVDSPASIDSK